MKLEQQVVSLELAKKLKELGVRQESLFWWSQHGQDLIPEDKFQVHFRSVVTMIQNEPVEYYSAFTVAELGEMLPAIIQNTYSERFEIEYEWHIKDDKRYHDQGWIVRYRGTRNNHGATAPTEADARAKMLIYLIENDLLNK